jgi:ribosomal-protein-alanine N-acetyltransferase
VSAIHTGRLRLRPVVPSDQPTLHALFIQPGVRRFIFDDEILTIERTAEIIRTSEELFAHEHRGLWLAQLQNTDTAIGFGAFWYFRDPPKLELLYGVGDRHLKKGYGREIASAVIEYGFGALRMPRIRASTDAAHVDSQRLLHDLQFTLERRAVVGGLDTVFYVRHASVAAT